MNRCLDYEVQTLPSLARSAEKPAWTMALVCLLLVWVVFTLGTAILVVALLLPGDLGLSDSLKALGNLLPADSLICMT